MSSVKPVLVEVNTKLPPAAARINWEEGAYLVVDMHYEAPICAVKWKHLWADQALVIDLAPTGAPVLLEVRQPWETWDQTKALAIPEVQVAGSARILTSGRVSMPMTVSCDPDRRVARLSFSGGRADRLVSVASGLAFELGNTAFNTVDLVTGHLAGLWIYNLPKLSTSGSLLRALRAVGPPIRGSG